MTRLTNLALELAERNLIPDTILRTGVRRLLTQRLDEIGESDCETTAEAQTAMVSDMRRAHVAPLAFKANEQHYEVPASFFELVLGPHLKYSCCRWNDETDNLAEAEARGLEETCHHADLQDGMDILELGCGWGSLTLWMAEHYPNSRITAVSNSASQREKIEERMRQRGVENVNVITCDMNDFSIDKRFDRVVSVEMFEHMRNYEALFRRIDGWLRDDGKFFMHIFSHRGAPYVFEDNGPTDWMSRYFFTGGIMPSDDLPLFFQHDLTLVERWRWDGTHYEKTANAWLSNMDRHRDTLLDILSETYGEADAHIWWARWRLFFIACAELFGYEHGQRWRVSHYLFEKHGH